MSNERRMVPRTQATRERELLTLDYHGREVKTRVLAEDRRAVRAARDAEWRAAVGEKMRVFTAHGRCRKHGKQDCVLCVAVNQTLNALLAAMEAK